MVNAACASSLCQSPANSFRSAAAGDHWLCAVKCVMSPLLSLLPETGFPSLSSELDPRVAGEEGIVRKGQHRLAVESGNVVTVSERVFSFRHSPAVSPDTQA